jgi:hypothetical protein
MYFYFIGGTTKVATNKRELDEKVTVSAAEKASVVTVVKKSARAEK